MWPGVMWFTLSEVAIEALSLERVDELPHVVVRADFEQRDVARLLHPLIRQHARKSSSAAFISA